MYLHINFNKLRLIHIKIVPIIQQKEKINEHISLHMLV